MKTEFVGSIKNQVNYESFLVKKYGGNVKIIINMNGTHALVEEHLKIMDVQFVIRKQK